MAAKVFLLGRPGSGKSTAFRYIQHYIEDQYQDWSAVRFHDYEILQQMFQFERLFQTDIKRRQFRPTEHNGFDVVDFSVLDTALKELEKQVRHRYSPTSDELIAIEFARDDYSKALAEFSPSFLKDAYFLFLDADIRTCIQRIHERVAHPTTADDHFVSEDILRSYYNKQGMPANLKAGYVIDKSRIKVINSRGSEQDFAQNVQRFVDTIFDPVALTLAGKDRGRNLAKVHNPFIKGLLKKVHDRVPAGTLRS